MSSLLCIFIALGAILCLVDGSEEKKYTTFQCIGGSQVLKTDSMVQASVKVFPLNNPEFRMCLYRNICIVNGTLTYYKKAGNVPSDYLPEGFEGRIHHLSYLRGFTMPIATHTGPIPADSTFHDAKLVFLDSNSWSFNYGHYLHDNVIPTFTAAKVFNLPFADS
eukprot:gene36554-44344_t